MDSTVRDDHYFKEKQQGSAGQVVASPDEAQRRAAFQVKNFNRRRNQ